MEIVGFVTLPVSVFAVYYCTVLRRAIKALDAKVNDIV